MLIATNGINTHKGAIWAMGLLISVIAQKSVWNSLFLYRKYLMMSASLLLFLIQNIVIKTTHGHRVKQKYGVNGAYEEAILGYPHIRLAIQAAKELDNDSYVQKQMHMLLVLMSSLDDTCVLHRSDQKTLVEMQKLAHAASQSALPNRPFTALLHFCQKTKSLLEEAQISLSASLFMLKIEELWTADTYICPMLLND